MLEYGDRIKPDLVIGRWRLPKRLLELQYDRIDVDHFTVLPLDGTDRDRFGSCEVDAAEVVGFDLVPAAATGEREPSVAIIGADGKQAAAEVARAVVEFHPVISWFEFGELPGGVGAVAAEAPDDPEVFVERGAVAERGIIGQQGDRSCAVLGDPTTRYVVVRLERDRLLICVFPLAFDG